MFGDNETVVNTASTPHGKLHKRHNALAFHRVREAIAARVIRFGHIAGIDNPADILTKHWDHNSIWPILKPLLFWHNRLNEDEYDKGRNLPKEDKATKSQHSLRGE
jgi:hypothetical protein